MSNQHFFEINLVCKTFQIKEEIRNFLTFQNIDFIECIKDNLDLHAEELPANLEDYFADDLTLQVICVDKEKTEKMQLELTSRWNLENLTLDIVEKTNQDWLSVWKENFHPIDLKDFIILAPWHEIPENNSKPILCIEPGMAFGTGHHATTRLVLEQIGNLSKIEDRKNQRLLDVGCGSGILAIAAKKMGFHEVWGMDIDPDALVNCTLNCQINGITLGSLSTKFPGEEEKFHMIVANILANVLIPMSKELIKRLRSKSLLVLSGILSQEAHEVISCYEALGLKHIASSHEEDWCALVLEAP